MYNFRPPQDSIQWNLGLILEISYLLGLGKPDVVDESWNEEELCELLSKNQIRHWWQNPPKKKKTLDQFISLVTKGEPYAREWECLFAYAIKNKLDTGARRQEVFKLEVFDKTSCMSVIIPKLKNTPFLDLAYMHDLTTDSPMFRPYPAWFFGLRSNLYPAAVLLISLSLLLGYKLLSSPKYQFGEVFTEVKFCLEKNFEVNPGNKCKVDVRSFSENDPKIYLSFESREPLEGLPEFNLQWLRNGELLLEKARPWIDAFAIDLKYASTHIKMQKFEYLSPNWAEPGRYHVRFYLEGEFVDEAGFYVNDVVNDEQATNEFSDTKPANIQ